MCRAHADTPFLAADRLEDLGHEVTVLPLPSVEEVAAAQVGGRSALVI